MSHWRLFIAIDPAPEIAGRIGDWVAEVRRRGPDPEGVRWTRRENYHLTLKFLGATDPEKVPEILAVMREVVEQERPVEISFGGVGVFPDERHPRVLWLGVNDPGARLSDLAARLETVLEPLGFPAEKRVYTPHLTLAKIRVATKISRERVRPLERAALPGMVRELILYRSEPGPQGSKYEVLGRVTFGTGRPVA